MGESMDKTDARIAFDLGTRYYGQGELDKAISYYARALNLFMRVNDLQMEADTFLVMGDISIELNNPEEAQKYYEKSIKKFRAVGDFKRAGMVSNLIANTYELQDAIEDAVMDYKRSLELFEKVKDHEREANVRMAMVDLESRRSNVRSSKKEVLALITYLIAIAAAEVSVNYINMEAGLVFETIILATLLIHSSIHESYNFSTLLRSMMILPIIRIIGLTIPLMQIPTLYWFPIVAVPLFAASYTLMDAQKLTRKKVGLVLGNIPLQLIIALSGVFLGFTEYLILKPLPLISTFSLETVLFAGLILVISTGFAEELLFRGILQKNAENVFGKVFGLLYASMLFTALHVGWKSGLDLIFVFCVAIFYGYAFQRTRSLLGVTLSHGLSNSFLFLIMPFIFPSLLPYITEASLWIMHYL